MNAQSSLLVTGTVPMIELPRALSALVAWRQWICWRAEPSRTRPGKIDKLPCGPHGAVANAHDPAIWLDAATACTLAAAFGEGYGVGFVFTAADPFFFVDIDACLDAGAWSATAQDLCGRFNGAAVEISQSGAGLHIIGQGAAPMHRKRNAALGVEFYTEGRFVALTGTSAIGDAGTDHTAALHQLVADYLQPDAANGTGGDWFAAWEAARAAGVSAEWIGPTDDALLIERALRSQSAAAAFGGKASFRDLWEANADALAKAFPDPQRPYDASCADAALAQHLAFWTGKDCDRIACLMQRSNLKRDKWERPDYLPRTILSAVSRQVRSIEKMPRTVDVSTIFRIENIAGAASPTELPAIREIKVRGGSLSENVREMESALIEQRVGIFQRGGMIVRPTEIKIEVRNGKEAGDLLLERVTAPALIQHTTSAAKFVRWDARSENLKQINCTREIVDAYLAGGIDWSLRVLSGIVNAPTLRADGSLLDRPGYDETTGLLFDPRGVEFPSIPVQPTQNQARRALAVFDELLSGFPFASREARAVALAGFLTVCIRRILRAAPLFGIDGTGAGSGKGLLADIITIVGTGRPASPINAGANEEELEKRIASMMIRGDLVISVDNLAAPLESSFLCSALTQETVSPRVLGQSKNLNLPTRYMFLATGNALSYVGDLNRRVITCLIDPKNENPSERVFAFDPIERAQNGRQRYVAAALTILRAYQAAGKPRQGGKVMGSYGEWCGTVRDALLWLGEADPVATCHPVNPNDPERERVAAVVRAWRAEIGTRRAVSARETIDIAKGAAASGLGGSATRPELYEALRAVAASMVRGSGVEIDPRRLSEWLGKRRGLVVGGFRFHPDDKGMRGRLWRLEDVSRAGESDD
jgi:hypothetical protein